MRGTVLYVYALSDAVEPPEAGGLEGASLRAVDAVGLRAVVSEHGRRPESDEDALWEHEEVIEALMETADVLPMRFGAVVRDEAELRRLLSARREELEAGLRRVRGAVELSVRAALAAAAPASGAGAEVASGAGPGTAYLFARMGERRSAEDLVARIHQPLGDLARESALSDPAGSEPLKAAYLVDRSRVEEFGERVERLAAELEDVTILCTGPWPPYSFVTERRR